jgi:myo-inositol-1(or 4)-monophosphatase
MVDGLSDPLLTVMQDFKTTCEQAAKAGGRVLLGWRDRFVARAKGPADLVTEADLASQATIRDIIGQAFPDHDFVGEEDIPCRTEGSGAGEARARGSAHGYRWFVDPLDGTTNYVHRLEHYCVSVALEHQGSILVGSVYDPVRDECFTAVAGEGACLNGQPLRTSQTDRLEAALVAASFSARVPRGSPEVLRLVELVHRSQATRRMGSAALNLCYVAAGRLDAYWASSVHAWDVAAGVLLVQEAGGCVTRIDGTAFDLWNPELAVSATPPLHRQLLEALGAATATSCESPRSDHG